MEEMTEEKERRGPIPGSLSHLARIIRKLEASSDRPRLTAEDRAVLASLLRQEVLRRRLVQSDKKRLEKLGVYIDTLEVPDWVKRSTKKWT